MKRRSWWGWVRVTHRFEGAIQLCVFIEYLSLHRGKGWVTLVRVLTVVDGGHGDRDGCVGSRFRCDAICSRATDVHMRQLINLVFCGDLRMCDRRT
jgi:hypothetical protein